VEVKRSSLPLDHLAKWGERGSGDGVGGMSVDQAHSPIVQREERNEDSRTGPSAKSKGKEEERRGWGRWSMGY